MRDAASQPADGLHLLSLPELFLELLPLRDIAGHAQHAASPARFAAANVERHHVGIDPSLRTLQSDDLELEASRTSGAGRLVRLEKSVTVLRVHDVGDGMPGQFR